MPRMLFFTLVNVKMPTINNYEQEKFHAQCPVGHEKGSITSGPGIRGNMCFVVSTCSV